MAPPALIPAIKLAALSKVTANKRQQKHSLAFLVFVIVQYSCMCVVFYFPFLKAYDWRNQIKEFALFEHFFFFFLICNWIWETLNPLVQRFYVFNLNPIKMIWDK